jgi:hypothetical protein
VSKEHCLWLDTYKKIVGRDTKQHWCNGEMKSKADRGERCEGREKGKRETSKGRTSDLPQVRGCVIKPYYSTEFKVFFA